jgi:hypothetical protein
MKTDMPDSIQQALHYLIQLAASEGVVVCGFAFRSDPAAITNFGNCSDKADIKLYEFLCKLTTEKHLKGLVIIDRVDKPV